MRWFKDVDAVMVVEGCDRGGRGAAGNERAGDGVAVVETGVKQ